MYQVSRDSNLKIPKRIKFVDKEVNSCDDIVEIKKAIANANNKKYNINKVKNSLEELDKELELVSKIPYNSNDLIVITSVKKLGAYIIAITEKSPKRFRGVFVNRMQNYCLETLEYLLRANFIRIDSIDKKYKEKSYKKKL